MKVELEPGLWLSNWPSICNGCTQCTIKEESAYNFDSMHHAKQAIKEARIYRPYPNARIVDDFV